MFAKLSTNIAAVHSPVRLDALAQQISTLCGVIGDDAVQALLEAIDARRREIHSKDPMASSAPCGGGGALSRQSAFPPKRPKDRSPYRAASIHRRCLLAASAPLPPALAAHFSIGGLATLRIVANEALAFGKCSITVGEIAARAGVCERTVGYTLKHAAQLGLLTIEERRRRGKPNLPNLVRIISREWFKWLKKGGCKKTQTTGTNSYNSSSSSPPEGPWFQQSGRRPTGVDPTHSRCAPYRARFCSPMRVASSLGINHERQ